jgi:hypothetical protein
VRDYIDENDKKNEIRLLFRHHSYSDKVIIAVEGQSDVRLFRGLIQHERIKFETIDGKQQLLRIMQELAGEFPQKLFSVCDADHDHLTGEDENISEYSIYMTDEHDAEVMLLNSPALDSFISEYSSLDNAETLRATLLENVFPCAYVIGILRWVNAVGDLKLNFKGLNFNQFIDVENLNIRIDVNALLEELLRRSTNTAEGTTVEYMFGMLEDFQSRQACKLQVCSGHDLTKIVSMVYRQRWASIDLNMDQRKVESALRVGYQKSFFKDSGLCRSISAVLANSGVTLEMC